MARRYDPELWPADIRAALIKNKMNGLCTEYEMYTERFTEGDAYHVCDKPRGHQWPHHCGGCGKSFMPLFQPDIKTGILKKILWPGDDV